MKRVLLSIPGVPNGYASMDSRIYHDPYPFLEALREVYGEVDLETFLWAKEFPHPWGEWMAKVPGMAIPLFYYSYIKLPAYRDPIVEAVTIKLKKLIEKYDEVYILSHSHGNRVTFDSISKLELADLNELVWISQAPAFNNVLFGAVPTSVEAAELRKVTDHLKDSYFYRIHADTLSGAPKLEENVHEFSPRWFEVGPVAHAMVRSREDMVDHFKSSLKSKETS